MTLKPKPLTLRKFINHQLKLERQYTQTQTEKEIKIQKEDLEKTNQTSGLFILFNLQEKQINDLKEKFFDLEDRLTKLEEN